LKVWLAFAFVADAYARSAEICNISQVALCTINLYPGLRIIFFGIEGQGIKLYSPFLMQPQSSDMLSPKINQQGMTLDSWLMNHVQSLSPH